MKVQYEKVSYRERALGALFGAAIGDALGVTHEFKTAVQISSGRFEMVGGGPFDFAPGEGSDDTALLEITLTAYDARGSFRPATAIVGMRRWLASGPPDVGDQTRRAIESYAAGACPPPDEGAQGNGGLMRAAAHALSCDDVTRASDFARIDTGLTHPSEFARQCTSYYAAVLWRVIYRDPRLDLSADPQWQPYAEPVPRQGGHCLHSLRLGLWALQYARSFEQGIDAIIRTGGDTDTNAMIAGALLGARFGLESLPIDWRWGLASSMADRLMDHANRLGFS